ncbi:MAG TPA: TonB-dependent receptor, partial [Magnetospirillaceae bacterium]|nr:TonB-dependent receptor [Magnetospirillaceae bacterium]
YSQGSDAEGYSVTGMYHQGNGNLSTDQPSRAIQQGLIGRFGVLDPSDGSRSQRWSLDGRYAGAGDGWAFKANAYYIHSTMTLWNDFTHLLNNPIDGDQEQQDETRDTFGAAAALSVETPLFGLDSHTVAGVQDRYDDDYVDRRHTKNRVALSYCNDGNGDYAIGNYACTADRVRLNDVAPYVQNTTHWRDWLRTTLGVREDYSSATDRSLIAGVARGSAAEWLLQPKGSAAFGPWSGSEFYVSAGKGFHSDDVRGVLGTVPLEGTPLAVGRVPLMARSWGEEIGLRNASVDNLQIQLAAFRQDFSSELVYNQDVGQDQATAPSRRQGIEISAQYRPAAWLELSADLAATHARYFKNAATLAHDYAITGGTSIANAPNYVGSFGILLDNLGSWFGGLEERILGPYPLTDGPNSPGGAGYKETNLDVGYKLTRSFTVKLGLFNLTNSKAYAAEYYYATAITPREVAKYGAAGIGDYQVHPLEPFSARLTVTMGF